MTLQVKLGEDGDTFPFDADRLLVREARELERLTGMGLQDFSDGIKRGKVDALVFMLYLAQRRQGIAVKFHDFDDVDIATLSIEDDADADDDGTAPDADEDAADADEDASHLPPPVDLAERARPTAAAGAEGVKPKTRTRKRA